MKVFQPFRLDTVNHCLWRAEERVRLTPRAFDILRYLVEHAERLVTQDEILEALWPETYVNPEVIKQYIRGIRKALGDDPEKPAYIETFPRRGYQFIAPVSDESAAPFPGSDTKRIVGRKTALAELDVCLASALRGQRQAIFVTGEAGIGKTALVDVFQQQATRRPNLRLARGQCIEGFGGKEAYYPILEALGSLVLSAEDGSLVQMLAKHAPTWLAQFPSLVKPEQRDWLQKEILGSTPGRMVREICEALEAMTAQGPLIMVLEDLHWVDNSTLDVISVLARRRVPAKLLLIATYRPADVLLFQGQLKTLKQDLLVHHLCHEITVERLEEADVAEYLAVAFADSDFPSGLAELIHHNSGGNALFMTGIVRDIAERGSIVQEGGKWVLTAPLQDIYPGIPETLQQMLENQFEQLSAEEQRILETCSVAGERFSVWAAAAMLETLPTSIEETCDRLAQRQQFIRFVGIQNAANGADSAHYEFRHSLYRQALYRQLSSANRSKLHRSLGEWLMAAYTAGRRELASELALHFEVGRDFEQAARCLIWTAENAARRFAHGDSIRALQLALELAQSLPARTRIELEIEVLQRMGDAHFALGAMSDSALAYETAAARAAEAGLRKTQIEALARLAVPAWYLDPPRGNDICEQAVEESRAHGDPLLLAQTQLATACFRLLYDTWRNQDAETCASARHTIRRLSGPSTPENMFCVYVQAMQGDYEEALKQAEAAMIATTSPAAYLLALGAKILSLMQCGRFGEVLRIVGTGRELAQKNGEDPWVFIFREAWLRSLCFDFEGVLRLSRTAMRSDAKQHAVPWTAIGMISAGYAELYRGRYAEALQCFAQVRDPGITPNFFLHWYWRMQARLGSSEVRLQAGDIPNARIEVDDLLESALSTADPHLQALAWEMKTRVAMAEQDWMGAREYLQQAVVIVEKFEVLVAAWQVHATAWQFYRHTKEDKPAEASRGRAEACILKIANSFARDEPLRASFLSAPSVARVLGASANRRAVS
jgi:DNA-binding winged helix-turn-helix (wHTH) protein/tetratricopeptide (TPR) repeat protein